MQKPLEKPQWDGHWTRLSLDKYAQRLRGLPEYSHLFSLVQTLGLFFSSFEKKGGMKKKTKTIFERVLGTNTFKNVHSDE